MANLDPAVRKETGYIAIWVFLLSLLMEAVFLLLHRWSISVLGGNLAGALVAIGNFFLLGWTVSKAVEQGKPDEAAKLIARESMKSIDSEYYDEEVEGYRTWSHECG